MSIRPAALVALVAAMLLSGCTHLLPIRTHLAKTPCRTDDAGRLIQQRSPAPERDCRITAHEVSDEYDLLFVEFDDQGMLYPRAASEQREALRQQERALETGNPNIADLPSGVRFPSERTDDQIRFVMEELRALAQPSPPYKYDGINLVVYVHGWNHNADADDEDVRAFRKALKATELAEEARVINDGGRPRRVVGLFVGWRGSSLLSLLQRATFWDRMTVARHVATGQARGLLAELKGFQAELNGIDPPDTGQDDACTKDDGAIRRAPRARMVLVGHSFGALLLYSATSTALTEALVRERNGEGATAYGNRIGDLVVLLNPAFEATRFMPLHRLAHETDYPYSRVAAPIMVSITSQTDNATRIAFPIGRYFGTFFESTSSEREDFDNRNTIGHAGVINGTRKFSYLTHDLTKTADEQDFCALNGWLPVDPSETRTAQIARTAQNLTVERKARRKFLADALDPQTKVLRPAWKRVFCGGATLAFNGDAGANVSQNTVLWNVSATEDISDGHNDIRGMALSEFLRQVYADAEICPFARVARR